VGEMVISKPDVLLICFDVLFCFVSFLFEIEKEEKTEASRREREEKEK